MWTKDSSQIYSFLKEKCQLPQFEVLALAGDASSRKYFRISIEKKESYVLMAWAPFEPDSYPFFNVLQHFKRHDIAVPEVINFDEKLGLVLLEDLGDTTLEQVFYKSANPDDYKMYYDQALSELIKIHFDSSKGPSSCVAFDLDFDIEKLSWELNYTKVNLFEKLLNYKFSDADMKLYATTIYQISKKIHEQPKYIQHRDYHSRNLIIKDAKIRVIDFQDARMGAIQYDLVSLLKDSYVDLPVEVENSCLEYYYAEARKRAYPIANYEEFIYIYKLQSIQRCLKACGSFAGFNVLKNDTRYLKYLNPTLAKVKKTLDHFTEFSDFANLISDTGAYSYLHNF